MTGRWKNDTDGNDQNRKRRCRKTGLKKYQQILTGKGDGQHEQHGSSEGVRRGRDTAN